MTFFKRMFFSISAFIVLVVGSLSFSFAVVPSTPSLSVQPFYFSCPEFPNGYFDGDYLDTDSFGISLDFSNLSDSETGTIHSLGLDKYSISVPSTSSVIKYTEGNSVVTNGWWNWTSGTFWNDPDDIGYSPNSVYESSGTDDNDPSGGFGYTETHGAGSGSVTTGSYTATVNQTANGDDSYTGSHDYSGSVTGSLSSSQDTSNHHRFRSFGIVYNNVYRVFICDARCICYSYLSNDTTLTLFFARSPDFSSVPASELYVTSLVFNTSGQVTSRSFIPVSAQNRYSCNISNGFWLSDNFPFPDFSAYTEASLKLRPAVFGDDVILFEFLGSIHSDLNTIHNDLDTIHNDLTSLTSSMQSAISNQTTTFQNMDAASGFDPTSVSNMLEYGSLEATFNAPSTNDLFSLSGGSYTDGMGFWRDRMNEVLFFNGSPILPMTIFSLTLGLAVLVIGRRVSGGGTA